MKRISKSVSYFSEMDYEWKKKLNLWNEIHNPLHKTMKRILGSVSYKKHGNLWNGFRNPFHTFLKWITNSVFGKKFKICETKFVIRFILFWNGSWIPFLEKNLKIPNGFWNSFRFFLKQITCGWPWNNDLGAAEGRRTTVTTSEKQGPLALEIALSNERWKIGTTPDNT